MNTSILTSDLAIKKSPQAAASTPRLELEPMQKRLNFEVFEQATPARVDALNQFSAPLFGSYVPAGFPAPAQDYKEESLDLNELCVKHPTATYYVRASGESMLDAGIHNRDILVVDRSLRAVHGNIVVAALNGDFTVKVLCTSPSLCLEPRNDAFSNIEVGDEDDFEIFGVVTYVIHSTLA